jgi:hypothetical protein
MKAQAFLILVGKMVSTQQDYFTAKKKGKIDAYNLLVKAKELEKQVMAVVKEGKLEPDEPLDTLDVQRPTRQQHIDRVFRQGYFTPSEFKELEDDNETSQDHNH